MLDYAVELSIEALAKHYLLWPKYWSDARAVITTVVVCLQMRYVATDTTMT
jgi:hypothetical protein